LSPPGFRLHDIADAAAIYVWQNGSYYPSIEAINSGAAVNNNATIPFEAGKRYKIRIINMSALASTSHTLLSPTPLISLFLRTRPKVADGVAVFFIGIDGHNMSVIETDGVEIVPYPIDVLTIAVAQRYSILVEARNETSANYAMTIMQSPDM
jgi:iron transport multicopper oxidase